MSLVKKLHLAAKHHLKERKSLLALKLAAELLFVDCGMKPSYLYDLNTADVSQIQGYLKELLQMGFIQGPLHVLNMASTVLIINVSNSIPYLRLLLHSENLHVIDVSAHLKQPKLFTHKQLCQIRSQLSEILTYLKPCQGTEPGTVSVVNIPCLEWNLCTIFGLLLQYPAAYWFDTTESCENCLPFTPLKHFTVQTSCPTVGLKSVQVYSFTVPESVYQSMQTPLQVWSKDLWQMFHRQGHFTDLEIITETVTLPAVAL
ncbi:UPF0739 protein C1orf74 homolog isoform X2 [Hyperolius riggenbachi]